MILLNSHIGNSIEDELAMEWEDCHKSVGFSLRR